MAARRYPLARACRMATDLGVYAEMADGSRVWVTPRYKRSGTVYDWSIYAQAGGVIAKSAYHADYPTAEDCAEALFAHIGQRVERWIPSGRD